MQVEAKDERYFLHELLNAVAVTQGNLRIAVRRVEQGQNPLEELDRLQKALEGCDRIAKLLQDMRELIRSSHKSA